MAARYVIIPVRWRVAIVGSQSPVGCPYGRKNSNQHWLEGCDISE